MPKKELIYNLTTIGYEKTIAEFNQVNAALEAIKKTKEDLNKQKIDAKEDVKQIRELNKALKDQGDQEAVLNSKKKELSAELRAHEAQQKLNTATDKAAVEAKKTEAAATDVVTSATRKERIERAQLNLERAKELQAKIEPTNNENLNKTNTLLGEQRVKLFELQLQKEQLTKSRNSKDELEQINNITQAIEIQQKAVEKLTNIRDGFKAEEIRATRPAAPPVGSTAAKNEDTAAVERQNAALQKNKILAAETEVQLARLNKEKYQPVGIENLDATNLKLLTEKERLAGVILERERYNKTGNKDADVAALNAYNTAIDIQRKKVAEVVAERQRLNTMLKIDQIQSISTASTDKDISNLRRSQDAAKANRIELKELELQKAKIQQQNLKPTGVAEIDELNQKLLREQVILKELELQQAQVSAAAKNKNEEITQTRVLTSSIEAQTAQVRALNLERQVLVNRAKLSNVTTASVGTNEDSAAVAAVNEQIKIQKVLLAEANLEKTKSQVAASARSEIEAIQIINDNLNQERIRIAELRLEKAKLSALPSISPEDDARIKQINIDLANEKLSIVELRTEKTSLLNQLKFESEASKASIAASKERIEENNTEAGSYRDLINKRKELLDLLERRLPSGGAGGGRIPPGTLPPTGAPAAPEGPERFDFNGELITFQQGVAQLRQYEAESAKLKEAINGVGFETNTLSEHQQHLGEVGAKVNKALGDGFNNMKGQLSQMIFMYTGWFAAFQEAGKIISENAKLSDSFADLQIRIHGTGDDVQTLFNKLKEIDTRTSLTGLVDIANVISKKGVQKEEIAGLTQSFDKLNVVLGQEIGEPQAAVANIIKLITIFNDDKHVTKQRVDEIGTSLFKLTTSGVATGEFLVNFAERVGAVRGITGLTLPNVLGLGAALQQLGQRTEVAGTAAVQLVTKVFADVPKFAKAAGVSIDEFREKLKNNPFEALVSVAEGLKNIKDDELASKFEDVVQAFDEVGIRGARIKAVLGDIGTNAQFVREKMGLAATSTADYANQTAAAALKQNTFAATLDKIRKSLELLGTDRGVQIVLGAVAQAILLIVNSLGVIIPILAAYGVTWTIANSAMLIAKASSIALNVANTIQAAGLILLRTVTTAYATTVTFLTQRIGLAAAATRLWAAAANTTWGIFGILIVAASALAAVTVFLASKIGIATRAFNEKARAIQIDAEVTEKANKDTAEQVAQLDILSDVVTSAATSMDTKRVAVEKLTEVNAKFGEAIKGNVVDLQAFNTILNETRDQLELTSRATAASSFAAEAYKKYLDVVAVRQQAEVIVATTKRGKTRSFDTDNEKFSEDQQNIALQAFNAAHETIAADPTKFDIDMEVNGTPMNSKVFFDKLKERENEVYQNYDGYRKFASGIQAIIDQKSADDEKKKNKIKSETLASRIASAKFNPFALDADEYEQLIKDITAARDKLKFGDAQIQAYNKDIERFQKILDEIRNKQLKGRHPREHADRLDKDELNMLNEIQAQMDLELALAEGAFAKAHEVNEANFNEQINFNDQIAAIHKKYTQEKIDYLESLKKLDEKEKVQVAQARKDIIEINKKLGTNISLQEKLDLLAHRKELEDIVITSQRNMNAKEKLVYAQQQKELSDIEIKRIKDDQDVRDREFNRQRQELDRGLTNQVNEIKTKDTEVQEDPTLTATVKAQHKLDSDKQILALQEQFNKAMDALEKQLNQKSTENLKKGADTKRDIVKDTVAIFNAQIKDAQDAGQNLRDESTTNATRRITEILQSTGGVGAAAKKIREIQQELANELLQIQVDEDKIELKKYEDGLQSKITSEQAYIAAKKKLAQDENNLTKATVDKDITEWERLKRTLKDLGNSLLENVLHIKTYTDEEKEAGKQREDARKKTEDTVNQAVNEGFQDYINNLNAQIDRDKEAAQTRNDLLFDQKKQRAQSQAEEDSLERQRVAANKKLDKEAAEEKKKVALKELAIKYALAVMESLAQFGLPLAILPIAAETALYFVQKANINAQQFARGGTVKKAPVHTGGQVEGPSHRDGGVPFNYEAEGKELMIINKTSAEDDRKYEVKGTVRQIASKINEIGGGVAFSSGAIAKRMFEQGGILGSSFTAPSFSPSNQMSNGQDLTELIKATNRLADETQGRIDRIEVHLNTQNLQREQDKQIKLNKVGNL